jgi:hypothetical protein
MRLRATVTQLWHDSSEEDEDAVSADAVWQPGSHEGSDAEDTGRADAPAPAAARDAAPRRLSHADLTQALLDMPAAHDTPAAAAPEALTQVRRSGCRSPLLTLFFTQRCGFPLLPCVGVGAWRRLQRADAGCLRAGSRGSAGDALAA